MFWALSEAFGRPSLGVSDSAVCIYDGNLNREPLTLCILKMQPPKMRRVCAQSRVRTVMMDYKTCLKHVGRCPFQSEVVCLAGIAFLCRAHRSGP